MTRLSKVLIGIAALAVVLLGLALAAPVLIDQDALKQRIVTAVLIGSGQRLHIDGDIDLRLLPRPSVELGPLELGAVDGAPAPVRIGRLRLEPDPWPLLIGDLRLDRVVVDAPRLSLPPPGPPVAIRAGSPPPEVQPPAAAGAAKDRAPAAGAQPGRQDEPFRTTVAVSAPSTARGPAGVVLPPLPPTRELLIRDFALRWQDPATLAVVEVQDGELRAGPLAPGQDGRIEGRLTLSGERPRLAGALTLSARLRPAADLSVIRIAPLHVSGDALAFGGIQGPPLVLDAELTWRPLEGTLAFDGIRTASAGLATTGNALLVLPPRPDAPALTGQIEMPAGDLRAWLEAAGIAPLPGGPQGLRRVGGSARFALAGGGLSLTRVRLQLDDTRAAGAARLGMHWGARPAGVAALALDRLDLDRYLGIPPAAGARASSFGQAEAPTAPAADPALPEPAGALTLGLSAGKLRAGRLVYGDLSALGALNAADWWADLTAADVYAGRIEGRLAGNLPTPHAPVALTLAATAEDIQIEPLLADAAGQAPVTGRGGFVLDLAARGADAMALRRSLGGDVSLSLREGDLTGFDIGRLIGTAGNNAARFATLTMSARGDGGVFRSDDLSARSPLMHLDGGGAIDVASEMLALDLQAVLVEPPNGAGIRELEGVPIPIRVSGHWARPSWQVDVAAALRAAARRALDERVNGRGGWLDKLEERTGIPGLRDGLEQGLRGLFGQ